ncbi:MAG: hypothetical protein IJI66_16610 [Erysipelotrichaceae bacterium]|nr:hypothetical protein [Erysipelotrichaceae bacterium]
MSKGFKKYLPVWLILFLLIHITAWVMPLIRSKAFWSAYGVVTISWLAQLLISYFAFKQRKEISTPIFIYSFVALFILFAMDGIGLYFFWEVWILVVASCVFLGINWIVLTTIGQNMSKAVERDEHVNQKVDAMRELAANVKTLYDNTNNKEIYRLYEALRYSDKASNEKTFEIEEQIENAIASLEETTGKDILSEKVDEIIRLINKRNNT